MIRLHNIRTDVKENIDLESLVINRLHINKNKIKDIKIHKKSLDSRSLEKFSYVFDLDVEIDNEDKYLSKDITKVGFEEYVAPDEGEEELQKVVVVGFGPAGMFASFMLSKYGYKVEVFERGEVVEQRVKDVDEFFSGGEFKSNSNVQFGEGGAGTFSDGKLNTLTHDKFYRMKEVFKIFVECGASEEIMYTHNPHLGTDTLKNIVVNLRNKIIDNGGIIHYNSKVEDILVKDNKVCGIKVNGKLVDASVVVLAIGHSARDTFKSLYKSNVLMESKPFAVGLRIIHNQDLIDKNQYPINYEFLPASSYKLTYKSLSGLGVYSFCMCPGGYVVDARSNKSEVVVNGMSNSLRDSGYANSAIVVTVDKSIYGDNLFDGVKFQEMLEHNAYTIADGCIPVQRYIDYKSKLVSNITNIESIKGRYKCADLNKIFPGIINDALVSGIDHFNKVIPGFDTGILAGVESRTSCPLRILRDEYGEANIKGLYPCGEGSGYSGGITTSAIDGIKTFEHIRKKYKNRL